MILNFEALHELIKASRKRQINNLKAKMLNAFHTGRDYGDLRKRLENLMRRIEVRARKIWFGYSDIPEDK